MSLLTRVIASPLKAAEQPAWYGSEEAPVETGTGCTTGSREWPVPEELIAFRERLADARRLLGRGRHAPGERALRQALGGLARRGDWCHAGQGALALASFLLARGRASDAKAVLDQAGDYWRRAENDAALVETATLTGNALIDLGRIDEAESVLGAALAAARAGDRRAGTIEVSLALTRCAFWRGRFDEADRILTRLHSADLDADTQVRVAVVDSRVAVGLHDLERAVSRAREAALLAERVGQPLLQALASHGAAFAHLSVGDLTAVERDVSDCVGAARVARDPLRGIRARLLLAESGRRQGRRSAVAAVLRRLSALGALSLPPIVRARLTLLKDLVETPARSSEVLERHIAATGLAALTLFTSCGQRSTHRRGFVEPGVDHMLEILRLCQNAESESTVLASVCARLRRQLQAAALGFVARDAGRFVTIASDGRRLEARVGERAIDAGIAVGPDRCENRVEIAVPVVYGGTSIGALAARWTLGHTQDLSGVGTILTMAAAAAAPVLSAALVLRTRAAAEALTARVGPGGLVGLVGLVGTSAALAEVREAIERGARAPFAVLIEGESGTGKELVARALHRRGPRRDRPFCTVNCAALPEDLIEAELFGHARGAFTGAVAERPGVFEEAHTGTLFLDEIGELALRAQAKVLRVIQEGELRRIGENILRRVDVRIVAATNRDLRIEAAEGRFRADLLYRLDVLRIVVPPLRERREDIAALADHFWRDATSRLGSRASLGVGTLAALARYDWPGNVRELQNVLAALAVRSPKRGVIPPTALPPVFGELGAADTWRLDQARRTFEERFVRAALVRTGGRRARAAAELGLTRQGLTKLMARLGIEDDQRPSAGDLQPS